MIDPKVQAFQKDLFQGYKLDFEGLKNYRYFYGNPVETIVPLDTAQNNVLILGAYPSARFAMINGVRDVPVGDNCGPFSSERYYDGCSVRCVKSGEELEEHYLSPMGLSRSDCWITDLVRVFLFKQGHVDKYKALNCSFAVEQNRSKFEAYAMAGMHWLHQELEVAQPKVIITLGAEVAGILRGVKSARTRTELLSGKCSEIEINSRPYNIIHLAHPGIIMRTDDSENGWPARHKTEYIPVARMEIRRLGCL